MLPDIAGAEARHHHMGPGAGALPVNRKSVKLYRGPDVNIKLRSSEVQMLLPVVGGGDEGDGDQAGDHI